MWCGACECGAGLPEFAVELPAHNEGCVPRAEVTVSCPIGGTVRKPRAWDQGSAHPHIVHIWRLFMRNIWVDLLPGFGARTTLPLRSQSTELDITGNARSGT